VPERDPEASLEFLHPEWLGDVVVGPAIKCEHLAILAVECGKHDHWHFGPLAEASADLDTIDVREPEIEHDEVGHRLSGA
jgi:hypothetical protein